VGGDVLKRKGIILAKSTPAKRFGITTGETIASALKKCPALVIVPPDHGFYTQASISLMDHLTQRLPCIEQYSIDECFADLSGCKTIYPDPVAAADMLRDSIRTKLGFTVNIGVSENKLLAKMASELEKPDKTHTLFKYEIERKMWPLPIEELFMVGRRTALALRQCNITTIGELAHASPDFLIRRFKNARGLMLHAYANGIDASEVLAQARAPKSIGNSTTLAADIVSAERAHLVLLSLCETIGARMRRSGLSGDVVSIGIKTNDFRYFSRQAKTPLPTQITDEIYATATRLFNEMWRGEHIRHLGVSVGNLSGEASCQPSFFDNIKWDKYHKMDTAIDMIRETYGNGIITRAGFLDSDVSHMTGTKQDEGAPLMRSHL
jgi:DNA polymerase-4